MASDFTYKLVIENDLTSIKMIEGGLSNAFHSAIKWIKSERLKKSRVEKLKKLKI